MTSLLISKSFHPKCSLGNYSECENCLAADTCNREIYFCRDDKRCHQYSFFDYACTHGGGSGCRPWRQRTNYLAEPFHVKRSEGNQADAIPHT